MSYVKINKEELKTIKSNVDSAIETLTTNFSTISNNIPVRRDLEDPVVIDANNKQGTNYLAIGKKYNDAISNLETAMSENDVITRLTNFSTKIQTIIDAEDEFNNVSFTDVENEIKEISDALGYLDKYSESEEAISLYAIADYSTGDKTSEDEDIEKENPKEQNGDSGSANEAKNDVTPTPTGNENGEGGTGGDNKEDTKVNSTGNTNGETGEGKNNEDENPIVETTNNNQGGSSTAPAEDTTTSNEGTNSEGGEGKTKEDEERNNDAKNGEDGEFTDPSLTDPTDPLVGMNIGGEAGEENEDEDPSKNIYNDNESGSTGEEGEDTAASGLTGSDNESGTTDTDNEKKLEDMESDSEGGEAKEKSDNLIPGIIANGLVGSTGINQDSDNDDVEIIDGSQDQGIKRLDPDVNTTEETNGEGSNSNGTISNSGNYNNAYNGESINVDSTEDPNLDKNALNGTSDTWKTSPGFGVNGNGDNTNMDGEGTNNKEDQDKDGFIKLSKIGQGITKGENGEFASEDNGELSKKSSTSFVGALLTVIGGIFGLNKGTKEGTDEGKTSTDNKTTKGLFANIKNFFKDIFGNNKNGFKGKDHTTIDTSEKDEKLERLAGVGKGISKANSELDNEANNGQTSDGKKGKNKIFDLVSSNGNGSNKGQSGIDSERNSNIKANRYRVIIKSLIILGIPGLIALTIVKIISYLWLIVLLLLLLLLIATLYTMFKEEKENEEKGNEEKEDLEN